MTLQRIVVARQDFSSGCGLIFSQLDYQLADIFAAAVAYFFLGRL